MNRTRVPSRSLDATRKAWRIRFAHGSIGDNLEACSGSPVRRRSREGPRVLREHLAFESAQRRRKFGCVTFEAGACDLVVERVALDSPAEDRALVGRFSGLSFLVADVESVYQRLLRLRVEFTEAPERQPWGGTLAKLRDPSGNQLQLVQYPGAA